MKSFIFRNNTIEQLFGGKDVAYSGYDDISYIPQDAESYVWFYQVPIKYNIEELTIEVEGYSDKLMLLLSQISDSKRVIIFTLIDLYTNKICAEDSRLENAIDDFNREVRRASVRSNVKVIESVNFFNEYPKEQWIDWKYYFISQMGINPKLAPAFKRWFNRRMEEIDLQRKKCLVLDLDNTLWGGVLGEDGIAGIKIGGDYPGKAYSYFQQALIELAKNGVILTVCSKNNELDVLEAWAKNPFITLKDNYISAYRINWENKADNLVALSKELNIGLDSFVFIDDNPTERELVKQMLPMVEVPDFPDQPYQLPLLIKEITSKYFGVYSITDEDRKKGEQYKANRERQSEVGRFVNFEDYLHSLQINITIESATEFTIPRVAQMTQKTNQFNLTTQRYTDSDIRSFITNGGLVYTLSVSDKFGDSGVTGCCILCKDGADNYYIDTLLLSCRILGKRIEESFVKSITNRLYDVGARRVYSKYIPTAKNSQVADFYERVGFSLDEKSSDGVKLYSKEIITNREIESYHKIVYQDGE